jgi:multiple sugar transport system substrate-binding protein
MEASPPGAHGRTSTTAAPRGIAALLLLAFLATACRGGDDAGPPRLTWYTYEEPGGSFVESAQRCSDASEGRYRIELAVLPNDADQQREQLVRRLAARDGSIDLISMDVIWTAEFARAGWVLALDGEVADAAVEGRLRGAVESATYQDRLWAAPFTGNAQLLWYRDDEVSEAPETWAQMIDEAVELGTLVEGQGARYEGLTVMFNSMLESAGGSILTDDGEEVSLEEEPTRRALQTMRDFARSPAAAPGLSTGREDDGRLGFESGRSAFMVNWPYVYPSAQSNVPELGEQMRWARYPSVVEGRPSRVTYGGFNLGVGAFTDHPELAQDAVACIADEDGQRAAAVLGGLPPTTAALYDDPEVRDEYPFADTLRESLDDASQRPQSPVYADISLAIARTLHPMSSIDPDRDIDRLRDAIGDALESRGLI